MKFSTLAKFFFYTLMVVVVLPGPFREMKVRRNSTEAQQSGHAPGLDHRSKMEKVPGSAGVAQMRAGVAQMRDNPEGGELNLADDVRRRCKKNSPSVLSYIGKI